MSQSRLCIRCTCQPVSFRHAKPKVGGVAQLTMRPPPTDACNLAIHKHAWMHPPTGYKNACSSSFDLYAVESNPVYSCDMAFHCGLDHASCAMPLPRTRLRTMFYLLCVITTLISSLPSSLAAPSIRSSQTTIVQCENVQCPPTNCSNPEPTGQCCLVCLEPGKSIFHNHCARSGGQQAPSLHNFIFCCILKFKRGHLYQCCVCTLPLICILSLCIDIAVGPPVCTYEGVQYLDQEKFHPPSKMQAYHNGSSTDNPFCTECQCIVSRMVLYIG